MINFKPTLSLLTRNFVLKMTKINTNFFDNFNKKIFLFLIKNGIKNEVTTLKLTEY